MTYREWYSNQDKPFWAPPGWLFAPVWTLLYIVMGLSFGYVALQSLNGSIHTSVLAPFFANLFFNLIFTPIQFGWKKSVLATIDSVLIIFTLLWAFSTISPFVPWVILVNIPYLLWVIYATILQITMTVLNRKG